MLPWPSAFETAIGLAADGVAVSRSLAGELTEPGAPFAADPGLAQVFYPDGNPALLGATVRNPALARTLETLAAEGPAALYGGSLGDAYVAGLQAAGRRSATTTSRGTTRACSRRSVRLTGTGT